MKHSIFLILLTLNFYFTYSQINIKPVAYFPLDGNANDLSGNKNNGVFVGNIGTAEDFFGNKCGALEFDGNSYIRIPASASLNSIHRQISITGRIMFSSRCNNSLFWATVVCKGNDTPETDNNPQYRLQFTSVTLSIKSNMINDKAAVPWDIKYLLDYDVWYFFAVTYDGSVIKFYIDGNEIFSYRIKMKFNNNKSPLYIGRDIPGNDEFFCGRLDDIRIFNKALSEKQILKIYNFVPNVKPCNTNDCDFPVSSSSVNINYANDTLKTKKTKLMIIAQDNVGYKDKIFINFNGRWTSTPIQLSENKKYIYEAVLSEKCNYLLFKSLNSNAAFDITVNRKKFGTINCSQNNYFGIKIIRE